MSTTAASDYKDRIRKVLREQLGLKEEDISSNDNIFDDLGADSLDQVEFIMALEEEFEIEISDEDAESLVTVQQFYDYIAMRLGH